MSQLQGDVVLWLFCVVYAVLILIIGLKTQWFKGALGRIFFLSKFGLFITACYIAGRRLGWIPPEVAPWFYFVVFGILGCAGVAYAILILKRNWHFWAWTKVDD